MGALPTETSTPAAADDGAAIEEDAIAATPGSPPARAPGSRRRRRPGRMNDPSPSPARAPSANPRGPPGAGSPWAAVEARADSAARVSARVSARAPPVFGGLPRRAPPASKTDGDSSPRSPAGSPAPHFADAPVRTVPCDTSTRRMISSVGWVSRAATKRDASASPAVDPDSVPLRTVKPDDQMWELTVEGAQAARAGREWSAGRRAPPAPTPRGAAAETTPVDARVGGLVKSPDQFLGGGAVPRLTAEEEARFNPATQPSWLTEEVRRPTARTSWARSRARAITRTEAAASKKRNSTRSSAQQQQPGGAGGAGGGVPSQPMGPVTDAPWLYTDPSGTVQGPFQRAELIEARIEVLPAGSAASTRGRAAEHAVRAAEEMLVCGWRYPGPRVAAQMQQEQQMREQQMREQQMREQQMREQQMREQQMREQQMREQQMREQMREQQMHEQQMHEKQMREQERESSRLAKRQAREQQMREQQMLEHQQQLQQQQRRVGLETLFGVGGGASPSSQPNLLANLFGSAPQGASMGGARAPPPGGEMMSLEDLERSMAAGGGGGSGLPRRLNRDRLTRQPRWGGAGVDRPPSKTRLDLAPPPAGPNTAQQQQQQQRQFEQVPASPPSKPAWAAPPNDGARESRLWLRFRRRRRNARPRVNASSTRAEDEPRTRGWSRGDGGVARARGGPALAQIRAEEPAFARTRGTPARGAGATGGGGARGGRPGRGPGSAHGGRDRRPWRSRRRSSSSPRSSSLRGAPAQASAEFWDSLPP